MRRLFHWLAHKTGNNLGQVETFWSDDRLMVGFRCNGCGELQGVAECGQPRPTRLIRPTDGNISHHTKD